MSMDNGIYILETTEEQYRVIYATAIDCLFDSFDKNESAPSDHINPVRAVEFFNDATMTADYKEALCIAKELLAKKKSRTRICGIWHYAYQKQELMGRFDEQSITKDTS